MGQTKRPPQILTWVKKLQIIPTQKVVRTTWINPTPWPLPNIQNGCSCSVWQWALFAWPDMNYFSSISDPLTQAGCFTDIVDRWENPLLGADCTSFIFYCSGVCVYVFYYFLQLSSKIKLGFWATQKPILHNRTSSPHSLRTMAEKHWKLLGKHGIWSWAIKFP